MNKATGAYLDCLRFLAALTVMLCHIAGLLAGGKFRPLDHVAFEAVGVFFVLSGFVIGYVTDTREKDLRTYTISRAARIYSVVIPCLLAVLVLDVIGRYLLPSDYRMLGARSHEALEMLFSLTFLNESWMFSRTVMPGSDGVFWSLCYEVPYYFIFGTAWFLRGPWRWLVPAVLCLCAGPYILAMFPLWLAGVLCYRICRNRQLSRHSGWGLLALAILLWAGFEAMLWHYSICATYESTMNAVVLLMYGSGLIFAVSIVGVRFGGFPGSLAPAANWLAGASFTLYLLHFPFACLAENALPPGWPALLRWSALVTATLCFTFGIAQFTERKKHAWRQGFEKLAAIAGV